MGSETADERSNRLIRDVKDLPRDELRTLEGLIGRQNIRGVVDADLLASGHYGHSRLVLCEGRVFVLEDGRVLHDIPLDDVVSAHTRDFVGNGALELRTKAGRSMELIRYSKSKAETFLATADLLNRSLDATEEEVEARNEQIAKVAGPKEAPPTYRCPNCSHPLGNPTDVCPRCTSKRRVMMRLVKMMKSQRRLVVAGMLLSILFTVANLGPGLLVREMVDKALVPFSAGSEQALRSPDDATPAALAAARAERRERYGQLLVIGGIFLGLIAAQSVISHYRINIAGRLGEELVSGLRVKLYRSLQRLGLSYYDREHTGRIMARVLTDTRVVQRFVIQAVQNMVIHLLTVVGIAVVLFSIQWQLAAVALLPIPVVVLSGRIFFVRFRKVFRSVRRKFANLSASVAEAISGMRVVKSFAQEEREIHGFEARNADVFDSQMSAVRARSRFGPLVGFMISFGVIAVWLVGGAQVLHFRISLGTLILFITYMNQFYNPIRQLMTLTETFQESATAAERIFNVMDMPSDVADHDQSIEPQDVHGKLVFQNVSFGYNEGERVLKNVNLVIKPGEMIGVVGKTGSGKSTIASLACRFYDPTNGRILLDGVDLKDIKSKWLRSQVGIVLQDSFLFAGTIRENIAYGRADASWIDIIQAAKVANAHDFIMSLPDGYDSEVGERGIMLSGGERQRVSIARAVLKDPPILILDEATSAVDTATESLIQEAMERLVHGRTTIAIAHRLSTLRNADRLVVMDEGQIIEEGSHEQLLEMDGSYAELHRIQAEFANAATQQ